MTDDPKQRAVHEAAERAKRQAISVGERQASARSFEPGSVFWNYSGIAKDHVIEMNKSTGSDNGDGLKA
jgi:hypothetical protein